MANESSQNLKTHRILSIAILIIGVILFIYMISVESEPGAIPLLLILFGSAWAIINQIKIKKHIK